MTGSARLSVSSPLPSRQRRRGLAPFAQQMAGVGWQVLEAVDVAGGPTDFDPLDAVGRAEAEMEAGIAARLIAPSAAPLRHLLDAAGPHLDTGADGVTVRARALEQERQEV